MQQIETIRIETPRLVLRRMRSSDLTDSLEHRSDPQVCRYAHLPQTQQQVAKRIQDAMQAWQGKDGEKLFLAIELTLEQKLIGELMFKYQQADSGVGEIGFHLNRHYQGQGYAFEAVSALIHYLFEQLKLQKITAICVTDNLASQVLMEKLGMQKEALLRSHYKIGDKRFDMFSYAMLAAEVDNTRLSK